MNTLTYQQVSDIHDHLEAFFAKSDDPISPPGIKNQELLESAVGRQFVGFDGHLKYSDPISNASSLCYGICSNHPFHNGNKRAALVALLCHLDANGLTFDSKVDQGQLYSFMLKIASHKFAPKKKSGNTSDIEVSEISKWVKKSTRQVKRGERVITFRELKKILRTHGFEMKNPRNNYIDIIGTRTRKESKGLFRKAIYIEEEYRVCHIPYPDDGTEVGKKLLKSLRQQCDLTEDDGCDSDVFYASERPIDSFIARFQKTLKRLAKT